MTRAKARLAAVFPFVAAICGGVLLRTAYPPFSGSGGAAFLAPAPILIAARLLRPRRAAAVAFAGMAAFWLGALSWFLPLVRNGGPLPLVLLGIVGLGAWCAAFSALAAGALSALWAPWRATRARAREVRRRLVEAPEGSPEEDAAAAELAALRRRIANQPAQDWNVPAMAAQLHISAGYLQLLYKRQFGVSCMDDVIASRVRLAKDYLTHTRMRVQEIAAMCGYNNAEHFSRQFRKLCGATPGQFRKEAEKE